MKGTIERQAFDFNLTTEKNKSATDGRSLTTSAEAVAPLRNGLSGVNQSSKFHKIEGFLRMKAGKVVMQQAQCVFQWCRDELV